jgi:hypothetical protein
MTLTIVDPAPDFEAATIYPDGWEAPRPYVRIVPLRNGA